MKSYFLAAAFAAILLPITLSAQVTYTVSNFTFDEVDYNLRDRAGQLLDNEDPSSTSTNSEGQLIQIGYFSGQTVGNFSTAFGGGEFMPLVSFLSGDSSTGDLPIPDGRIILSMRFDQGDTGEKFFDQPASEVFTASSPYPTNGSYLAVRWYDSGDTSGFYNTATASNWLWSTPTNVSSPQPPLDFLSASNLTLESTRALSNGSDLFASIPEPGFGGLMFAGVAMMAFARRRKAA